MLDLLCLVIMTNLHLLASHLLQLLLQPLLLVSESLERQNDLLNLVLALLKHLLLLAILSVETFTLTTALLFVASRIFNLSVLDLDELAKVLVFLLERLILGHDCLLLLL